MIESRKGDSRHVARASVRFCTSPRLRQCLHCGVSQPTVRECETDPKKLPDEAQSIPVLKATSRVLADSSPRHGFVSAVSSRPPGSTGGPSRRGGAGTVDEDGAADTSGRTGRGDGIGAERTAAHASPSHGCGDQQGISQEGTAPRVHDREDDGDPDGERDYPRAEGEGDDVSVPAGRSVSSRSVGLREACELDLRGSDGAGPEVCSVGQNHQQGGGDQPTPSPMGSLDGAGAGRGHGAEAEWREDRRIEGVREASREDDNRSIFQAGTDIGDADQGCVRADERSGQVPGGEVRNVRPGPEVKDDFATQVSRTGMSSLRPECKDVEWQADDDNDIVPRDLPEQLAMSLEWKTHRVVPDALSQLYQNNRPLLFEVACSPNSILTSTVQRMTGNPESARRLSFFNGFDLSSGTGVRQVLREVTRHRPEHVWLSLECGPFSRIQHLNRRTEQQRKELELKRTEALKQYVGGLVVYLECHRLGISATWEWSETCEAWRLPMVQKVFNKVQPQMCVVKGCAVGLRSKTGILLGKGWKIATTHVLLAERMRLPCQCEPGLKHAVCEGSMTRESAYYTPRFAEIVSKSLLQGCSHAEAVNLLSSEALSSSRDRQSPEGQEGKTGREREREREKSVNVRLFAIRDATLSVLLVKEPTTNTLLRV